jgi:hypothetical protein
MRQQTPLVHREFSKEVDLTNNPSRAPSTLSINHICFLIHWTGLINSISHKKSDDLKKIFEQLQTLFQ